jgi:hypothetical protein
VVGLVWFQQEVHKQGSIFPITGVFCMLVTIAGACHAMPHGLAPHSNTAATTITATRSPL